MIIDRETLELEILPRVEKPAQYAGGELNSLVKDWEAAPARMAFAFPDSYEIGMSHLGLRLLYEAVNNGSPHLMERVFMPLPDMQAELRRNDLPLFTLESRHELRDFDVVGFTLQYELSFSNILAMLELARIPLTAAERKEGDPIIAAGGPCAYNAEPLADIVDLVFLGEGEELDREFLDLAAEGKSNGWSREELLRRAAAVPGVYVPRFYEAEYDDKGRFRALALTADTPEGTPLVIEKRIMADLDAAPFPERPILPNIRPVHDRVMLELMRGCTHGCRFCQAGMIYRPRREKDPALLRRQAVCQCAMSGYDDIALLSLSSADYGRIQQLMEELTEDHAASGVGLSLPSLRVDAFSVDLAARTQEVRKSGITLAPEAGSSRLRDVINKGVTEEDILTAATAAFSQGYTHIKLYFMLGLPFESDSDVKAIAALCRKILQLGKANRPAEVKKPLRMSLGVSSFIPKCHTPFQWQPQCGEAELKRRQDLLKEEIKPMRQVTVNFHDRRGSLLEAAFARGDRRLSRVLLEAHKLGCQMDAWSESFRFDLWREAFAACGLTPEEYAEREYLHDDPLPWQHLSCGVDKEWLWRENIRAGRAQLTPDCSRGECSNCGVCGGERQPRLLPREQEARPYRSRHIEAQQAPCRCRVELKVDGAAKWVSHLDLLGMVEKALRRSGLPIAYSQGFNPHMLISWGPAHPVGLASDGEYADLTFSGEPPADWQAVFGRALPPGLTLVQARTVAAEEPSLMAAVNYACYRLELPAADEDELARAVERIMTASSLPMERVSPKGRKTVDLRPALAKLTADGRSVNAELWLDRGAAMKMNELAQLLIPDSPWRARRTGLFISDKGGLRRP
ncbi:MAG: TIGR03960 family B12-binding radical SAM protein [Firmicutes bacterium]|nr:TIGR03960 family B12-binding radical SAM protein [Bacillota bacterium]